jgi:YVTN family beta-propeller protein
VSKLLSRWRLSLAACGTAGLVAVAVPVALGHTGSPGPRPAPVNSAPGGPKWTQRPRSQPPRSQARRATGDYRAYIALAGGYGVATVDVATRTFVGKGIATDAGQGVAVTPDGKKLYIANTGQYEVLVADPVTGTTRPVRVGPYPRDVAVSPDGGKVYAAVTGGDTGAGGSAVVAVIDTATDQVIRYIPVGTAPRQVVFSADGARAYVTHDRGVSVIDVAGDRVVRSIRDRGGPQGIAVGQGSLYVAEPRAGRVSVLDAVSGKVQGRIPLPDQPWAVDLTPDGRRAYVTEINGNVVAVIDTATRKVTGRIVVGKLPESVAVTPDGSEAWVGNGFSGSVSVIDVASGAVVATVVGGTGTKPINASPLGIAFGRTPDLGAAQPDRNLPDTT